MAHWVKHFGEKLIDNSGKEYDTAAELEGKYVLIYFSAHWCPPCRQFTPFLAKLYETLKSKNAEPFEIIFNSWDKSEEQFKDYFATMPWKSFPSSFSSPIQKNLNKLYKVSGIPTLIVLDKDGKTITTEGRGAAMKDPNGVDFPWFPKKVNEIIGDTLVNNANEEVSVDVLQGKTYGILFGGKWIGEKFTSFVSHLSNIRAKILVSGKEFPLVYASLDKTTKDYKDALTSLPPDVLTFEFKDPRVEELAEALNVNSIPNFTIINSDGTVLNHNVYISVLRDKTGDSFPWGPQAVEHVDLATNEILNTSICALAFTEESSPLFSKFKTVAESYHESFKKGERDEVNFYFSDANEGVGKRMRDAFKVGDQPAILFLQLPKFYISTDFDSFESTLNDIVSGNLASKMSSL